MTTAGALDLDAGGDPPLVSVIVPARNAEATIDLQLEALSRQTFRGRWEVLIVDNGSDDGTAEIARRWHRRLPGLRVVSAPTRRGASYARNVGARLSRGELLLFCDADDVVEDGWVEAMVNGLDRSPAAGGNIERRLLNDAAAIAGRPGAEESLLDTFGFLRYPLSANCGVRREVWNAVGGFSLRFPYGSDDVEFFWRAQLLGYRLAFVPDAVVHYRLRPNLRSRFHQYFDHGRTHPRLYRRFAGDGMPRSSPAAALREWAWVATHPAELLAGRERRCVWVTRAALRLGRLAGSLRNRTLYL